MIINENGYIKKKLSNKMANIYIVILNEKFDQTLQQVCNLYLVVYQLL